MPLTIAVVIGALERPGPHAPALLALIHQSAWKGCSRKFLRADGRKRPVAGIFTAPAGFGAYPAVLHVHLPCVGLTLLATQAARFGASLESSPGHRRLELRLPGEDPPRTGALVRAVEAHGDAALHVLDHFLAEAGIGTGRARLGAVEARLYALDERLGVHSCGARVGIEHLPGVSH